MLPDSVRSCFNHYGITLKKEGSLGELLEDVEGLLADVRKQTAEVTESDCVLAQDILDDMAQLLQKRRGRAVPSVTHLEAHVHVA